MVWSAERNPAGWAERRKAGLASRGPSSNRPRVKTCVTGCNSLSRITVRQASPLLAHLPPSISTGVAHPKLPKWRTSRYRRPTRMAVPPFEHSTHPLTSAFTWDTIFPWPADEHRQKTRRSHRSPHHALCNHHPPPPDEWPSTSAHQMPRFVPAGLLRRAAMPHFPFARKA